ncbi:MAG TPA: hypothetical protein VFG10_06335 [Saprospiraceae bacterium]|nr:hypothetical protein [Saprospiraceae bacterium]
MTQRKSSGFTTILLTGLLAGTLDITAAIVILAKMRAGMVFKYIASGAFGKEAYTAGPQMILFGAFFHYLIAMTITVIYFLVYPRLSFLKTNKILSAAWIGIWAWIFMNIVVVPISQIGPIKLTPESVIKNLVILMVCIGLPVSILISQYYTQARDNSKL